MAIRTPPLDLDAGMVSRHYPRDPLTKEHLADGVLDRLTSAASFANAKAKELYELAEAITQDRSHGAFMARSKFAATATRVLQEADRRADEAMKFAFEQMGHVQKSIRPTQPVNFLAAEIRSGLRQMKAEDRRTVLANLEDETIGAIASAPSWLSGMSQPDVDLRLRQWTERKHPEEAARLRRIGEALGSTQRIGASFKGYVESLVQDMQTPSVERSKRVEAAQEAVAAE